MTTAERHSILQVPAGGPPAAGFTLIELVLVMGLLVLVMTTSYRLVVDCLDTERRIEKLAVPEKVAEGILALFRRDLSGTYFRNMGRQIFLVADGGLPPQAHDEIRFLSTVEPTPVQEMADGATVSAVQIRTITGIGYFLRQSRLTDNVEAYTLFRREITEFDPLEPLQGRGMNYEVYDKVKYLSIECFDGWSWYPDWSSELRIQAEEDELAAQEGESEGVRRVTTSQASPEAVAAAPGVDPTTGDETLLPPAAVPVAVRLELGIYVSTGDRIERDAQGEPLVKKYSTIVPILAAQRIPIVQEESDASLTGGAGDAAGEDGARGGTRGGIPDGNAAGMPPGLGGRGGLRAGGGGGFGGRRSSLGAGGRSGGLRAGQPARAPGGGSRTGGPAPAGGGPRR